MDTIFYSCILAPVKSLLLLPTAGPIARFERLAHLQNIHTNIICEFTWKTINKRQHQFIYHIYQKRTFVVGSTAENRDTHTHAH